MLGVEKKVEAASEGPARPVSRARKSSIERDAHHGYNIASHSRDGAHMYICVSLLWPPFAEVRDR